MKSIAEAMNCVFYGRLRHASRFSIVGVANTLVDFLMFTAFHKLFDLSFIMSQVIGYSAGIANSFIFNKKWTFNDSNGSKKSGHELLEFVAVNLISLATTLAVMNFLVKNFNFNVYASKIVVTLIAQAINFLAYKLLVFNGGNR